MQLSELNYLYPFSKESVPLIEALLSDLVSTVSTYKDLESEHAITKEELRLAVDEINRVGVVDNPRLVKENNELHVRLIQESDRTETKLDQSRKDAWEKEERSMKLELMVNQLRFENQELKVENQDLRALIDSRDFPQDEDLCSIWLSGPVDIAPFSSLESTTEMIDPAVSHLAADNQVLNEMILSLRGELDKVGRRYGELECKFLQQSPLTLSGNWGGGLSFSDKEKKVIENLNAKLDFVNERYKELKELHARCGIVTDAPLLDLRESRKEINLMAIRMEKLRSEKTELMNRVKTLEDQQQKTKRSLEERTPPPEDVEQKVVVEALKVMQEENRDLRKQLELAKRNQREVLKFGDRKSEKRMVEIELRRVTEDRNELIAKLAEIERSVSGLEKEIFKIERENMELKREKLSREESFVGISHQLNEVNHILNSLSDESQDQAVIRKLEQDLVAKESEIAKLRGEINDLKAFSKSIERSRDLLANQVKQAELEKNNLVENNSQLESQMKIFQKSLSRMDAERDELQRVCDEQTEQLDEARKYRVELAESEKLELKIHDLKLKINTLENQVRGAQTDLGISQNEIDQVTRDNETLVTELNRAKNQVVFQSNSMNQKISELMETLRITEIERNDVLSLYKQIVEEKNNSALENARISHINQQLLARCRQAEIDAAARDDRHVDNQITDLLSLVELERAKNRELYEYVEALSAVKLGGNVDEEAAQLRKTVEQQYTLIGEMDAEHARLIVENDRLKSSLSLQPLDP